MALAQTPRRKTRSKAKLRNKLLGKRLKHRQPANIAPAQTLSELTLGRVFKSSDETLNAANKHAGH